VGVTAAPSRDFVDFHEGDAGGGGAADRGGGGTDGEPGGEVDGAVGAAGGGVEGFGRVEAV
jgi:hypothetical protein